MYERVDAISKRGTDVMSKPFLVKHRNFCIPCAKKHLPPEIFKVEEVKTGAALTEPKPTPVVAITEKAP
jgi:hypothetical protein